MYKEYTVSNHYHLLFPNFPVYCQYSFCGVIGDEVDFFDSNIDIKLRAVVLILGDSLPESIGDFLPTLDDASFPFGVSSGISPDSCSCGGVYSLGDAFLPGTLLITVGEIMSSFGDTILCSLNFCSLEKCVLIFLPALTLPLVFLNELASISISSSAKNTFLSFAPICEVVVGLLDRLELKMETSAPAPFSSLDPIPSTTIDLKFCALSPIKLDDLC
mmetsp:Transcript_6675/g.8326  ORF Transcript_6675/g.8326 Transcript_6675/m.8326 type:complete len:217 (+) Transcript_6675:46-696(+)